MIREINLIWLGSFIPFHDKRPYLNRVLDWKRKNAGFKVRLWYSSRTLDKTGLQQVSMLPQIAPEIEPQDVTGTRILVGVENHFANEAFDKLPNYGAASDILRVSILLKFGGFYFDTDIEPVKCLDGIKAPRGFLVNAPARDWSNDILYAKETKNRIFLNYQQKMISKYTAMTKEQLELRRTGDEKRYSTMETTGPGALYEVLKEAGYQPMINDNDIRFPKGYVRAQEGSDESWL